MKIKGGEKELSDIEKIENFLVGLGFVCISYPYAQHLIYSKSGEKVIIKNNRNKDDKEVDMK
jgi:hypothetical protein